MRQVSVSAALIIRTDPDGTRRLFATQRGYGDWKGWWEFPGGKQEEGETPEQTLVREIREELAADIAVERLLATIDYDYPTFHLHMHCYICSLFSATVELLEHDDARWLSWQELRDVRWLPADREILGDIELLLREAELDQARC